MFKLLPNNIKLYTLISFVIFSFGVYMLLTADLPAGESPNIFFIMFPGIFLAPYLKSYYSPKHIGIFQNPPPKLSHSAELAVRKLVIATLIIIWLPILKLIIDSFTHKDELVFQIMWGIITIVFVIALVFEIRDYLKAKNAMLENPNR